MNESSGIKPRSMTARVWFAASAVLVTGLVAGTATLQPDRPPSREPGPEMVRPSEPPMMGRDVMRTVLSRQLERVGELETKLEAAIRDLDGGADPADVLGALPSREDIAESFALADGPRLGDGRIRDRIAERRGGPDGPGGPPEGGPDPRGEDLTDEQLQRIRAFIDRRIPPLAARLERAAERSPEAEDRLLRRVAPRLMETVKLAEKDRRLAELRVREMLVSFEVVDAMRAIGRAGEDSAASEQARTDLESALRKQLETRLAFEQRELERTIENAKTRRDQLQQKAADLDARVEERAVELIEQARNWRRGRGQRSGGGG
ncbi:MAG: hypothetical protein AAGI17_03225 [Planctomycetota bacterium]